MWWNYVECPPRQLHKTFIHFNEDDRQLLPTESLFCIVDRFVVRIRIRQTCDVCGKQMAVTMRCHHAHDCCHFDFIVYFVLTSFYCYLWSRIIHPNSQHETVKFHHLADDFMAMFTVLGVAYCARRVHSSRLRRVFGFDGHYPKLYKCVVNSLKFYMILAPGQQQIFDQLISLECTTKLRLQTFHICFL